MPISFKKMTIDNISDSTIIRMIRKICGIIDENNQNFSDAYDGTLETAQSAESKASEAKSIASEARTTANESNDISINAESIAENAQTVANGIDAKATSALENSENAVATAEHAESVANGIDAKATSALENSENALESANDAKTTVDNLDVGNIAYENKNTDFLYNLGARIFRNIVDADLSILPSDYVLRYPYSLYDNTRRYGGMYTRISNAGDYQIGLLITDLINDKTPRFGYYTNATLTNAFLSGASIISEIESSDVFITTRSLNAYKGVLHPSGYEDIYGIKNFYSTLYQTLSYGETVGADQLRPIYNCYNSEGTLQHQIRAIKRVAGTVGLRMSSYNTNGNNCRLDMSLEPDGRAVLYFTNDSGSVEIASIPAPTTE